MYNGPSEGSPLIAQYCGAYDGTSGPGAISTESDLSAMAVKFVSDHSNVRKGRST